MTKTITLDGLMPVTIKQSAYDMARFCWIRNRSEADIFASCVNSECTENADEVRRIPAGEYGMLDTESYEKLYLSGSGEVEIITTAFLVCPFNLGGKGGGSGGMKVDTLLDITISRGDLSGGDFSSCNPPQNSIITLSGNMDDYKFIVITNTNNGKIWINDSRNANAAASMPRIFYTPVFKWGCLPYDSNSNITIANLYYLTTVLYVSANQIKIKYAQHNYNTDPVTERLVILGIK